MIDGCYTILIDTPLGRKPGSVDLRTEGNVVYANIDAPIIGKQTPIATANGNKFETEGSLKIPLVGKIDYTLKGEVNGDVIDIIIDSSKGQFELSGTRA